MKDTAKGFAVGLIFGVGLTIAAAAAVMALVITPKTNAAIADAKTAQQQVDVQKCATEKKAVASTAAAAWRDIRKRQSDVATAAWLNSAEAGYTALLEPAPAGSSALQLFDVVRPGLGTILAKMQAAQSPQIAVRWVVAGHVKPMTNSTGYSYCWLNAGGEIDPTNCPVLNQ